MKTLYIDCFSGASGDKFLGGLIDAGLGLDELVAELNKLKVDGFDLTTKPMMKHGITGTKVTVATKEQKAHRHLSHIVKILDDSSLEPDIIEKAKAVFTRLAEAEAKVHNTTPEKIHFHEVGALDAIVDIVGAIIGLSLLKIETIICSEVAVGSGFVECDHGTMPLPAPATLELLKEIPLQPSEIKAELTTPTGAALLATLVNQFGTMPSMTVTKIGYGAGFRDLPIPNLLRMVIGHSNSDEIGGEEADLIETNIDDMNPEFFDFLCDRLREAGAVDVYLTQTQMKKNRPGVILSALSPIKATQAVTEALFRHSSSIGLRINRVTKRFLPREIYTADTPYGKIRVKVCRMGQKIINIAPEYEDCRVAAEKHDLPIADLYDLARNQTRENLPPHKE